MPARPEKGKNFLRNLLFQTGKDRPKNSERFPAGKRSILQGVIENQPLTAPAITPSMMYFWHTRYMTMIGRTVIMMQAIMGAISTRP